MKKTAKWLVALTTILLIVDLQTLNAQKLEKGFKYIADSEYVKAMDFFVDAQDKKIELSATYYALSKLYGDKESPYFSADKSLMCIKNAKKQQKIDKTSEDIAVKYYNFDSDDIYIQYNYALYLVLNYIDKIETITNLFRMGLNDDYERGILEEKAFKCALYENTTLSYSRFLEFYKDSKYATQAKENYIKAWFIKADSYIIDQPNSVGGFNKFRTLYPESEITKNCRTVEEYVRMRNQAVTSKDYDLDTRLYGVITNADSLNLHKDNILQYFISNFCKQETPSKTTETEKPEFKINKFITRETEIEIGSRLYRQNVPTQKIRQKSTPSGKDFVLETYGDNRYAMNDFNRGRRAIAFFYRHYFDTDIDWDYFAAPLEKVDFDDPRFKAAIARLQKDFPKAFYPDNTNSVGNNVFTRICGAEIINNFGVYDPVFEQFENQQIPGTAFRFKSSEHYSSFRNTNKGRNTYYFVTTTPDSLVRGAYALVADSTGNKGYRLLNIAPDGNKLKLYRSNCPGLIFYERKWCQLYYLEEQKNGDSSIWIVRKKYKRE